MIVQVAALLGIVTLVYLIEQRRYQRQRSQCDALRRPTDRRLP